MTYMAPGNALVITDTPDNVDYPKLLSAATLATETGTTVIAHNVCFECPSITTVPPNSGGRTTRVTFKHESWCPTLARHDGRELTAKQARRHRRYMDGK